MCPPGASRPTPRGWPSPRSPTPHPRRRHPRRPPPRQGHRINHPPQPGQHPGQNRHQRPPHPPPPARTLALVPRIPHPVDTHRPPAGPNLTTGIRPRPPATREALETPLGRPPGNHSCPKNPRPGVRTLGHGGGTESSRKRYLTGHQRKATAVRRVQRADQPQGERHGEPNRGARSPTNALNCA